MSQYKELSTEEREALKTKLRGQRPLEMLAVEEFVKETTLEGRAFKRHYEERPDGVASGSVLEAYTRVLFNNYADLDEGKLKTEKTEESPGYRVIDLSGPERT